jgi:uncharacterized protein
MTTFTVAPSSVDPFRPSARKLGSGPQYAAPRGAGNSRAGRDRVGGSSRLAFVPPVVYLFRMTHTTTFLAAAMTAAVVAGAQPLVGQDQPAGEPAHRVIHVSSRATVQRAPDRAVVQLAVETLAPTAGEAMTGNAATMDRVLAALRRLGVPEARIRTTRIELHPRYETRRDGTPPAIVGYQAANQVMVELDDLDLVGRVIDAAVGAGANRVTGVAFQLRDLDAAYHEALRLAVARARTEAEVIADALGEPLGPPIQVSTGAVQLPPPQFRVEAMRMDVAAAAPPVQPGELEVPATVSITYLIGS